jgi:periplasmic protein TonB
MSGQARIGPVLSALAVPAGMTRRDTVRWGICFAVVLLAHGAAALAFISAPDTSDFGVDTPVVTLELPDSLVTAATPPTDLAPGPKEEETEATPPPKEETRLPEPEAEVALPEPPKPEPPQEQKLATAPPASHATPKSVTNWQSELAAHIEHFKRYPADARAHGEQGIAKIAFTIDHEGHLLASRIVQSSGSAALDQETLEMLVRAQPMPKPPGEMKDNQLTFVVPVRFNIR